MSLYPFTLDPFQEKALSWIDQEHSLLISAPTGSGKTLIAEYAIDQSLARNEEVIYTAPVKALSNQKYRDFRARYGDDKVGILTGDVSINADAPIVIMTTEIYRNCLFGNMDRVKKVRWVIFDEIHYLDDPERGTVWEEALLFTPQEIRILALSATIPNVKELEAWIDSIHDRPIAVIEEFHRPVPLQFYFQCQGKFFDDIKRLRAEGYLHRDHWRLSQQERRRGMRQWSPKPNRLEDLLQYLQDQQKLPAIYFAFGRRRTETLARDAVTFDFLTEEERKEVLTLYGDLLQRYDLESEKSAVELRDLVARGIAFHHAGMLPSLKEVVEQLFTSRLIKMIFTTETFALGINMPARTVIFDELEKFYGNGFRHLTTRDFFQMAGRAGRRGLDSKGFVIIRIDPRDTPFPELQRILYSKSEAVESQLNTAYATLLNLYRDLGPKLLEIYPKTFHHFQSSAKGRHFGQKMMENRFYLLKEMGYFLEDALTAKGEFSSSLFGHELLLSELHEQGFLETLDDSGMAALLAALVFEPRKDDELPPKLGGKIEKIKHVVEECYRQIHKLEFKYHIHPFTKPPAFHMAQATVAWVEGAPFDRLFQLTTADEGELVRYFRMVIQLLRELMSAAHVSDKLRASAGRVWEKMNRGVVDAERQLRA